jgi:hypothetical protein
VLLWSAVMKKPFDARSSTVSISAPVYIWKLVEFEAGLTHPSNFSAGVVALLDEGIRARHRARGNVPPPGAPPGLYTAEPAPTPTPPTTPSPPAPPPTPEGASSESAAAQLLGLE